MALLLFGVLLAFASATASNEQYNNSVTLDSDGNFLLFWNNNVTHVTFEVRVKTKGYVAFGLSPNGNMFPADVVIGWVKDGKTYFKDRHTTTHALPAIDKSQDWFLLSGEENDFGTVLRFVRKIDTCDSEDIAITNSTQRIIYAYHPDDPVDEHSIIYHGGERRGTKSVCLLNVNKPPATVAYENIKIFEFLPGNYQIPDKDTTYLCVGFQMPDFGGKHHMIQFEPIFTPGNEKLLHHIVIQRCPGQHPNLDGALGECFGRWPQGWPDCPEIFVAWAAGGGSYYFPAHTGYPVGGQNDYSFYVMQIHYDNPTHKFGVIDNSGIRMRLTPKLRQHDVGSINVGHTVTKFHVIPPSEPAFVSKGYCAQQCLSKGMHDNGIEEVKVMAILQHGHLLATGIKTRHFRNGTEMKPLYNDPSYDFFFQEFRTLKDEITVKKGGLSTREEMCESIMYHYPKLDVLSCTSFPNYFKMFNRTFNFSWKDGDEFVPFIKSSIDWSNATTKSDFIQKLNNATLLHICNFPTNNVTQTIGNEVYLYAENQSDYIPYSPPRSACHI